MKKNFYVTLSAFLVILFSLQSCKKVENDPATSKKFELKGVDGKVIQQLPPSLLKSIHSNLVNTNRIQDAIQLYASYDTVSGYLKSLGKTDLPFKNAFENEVIDSSKMPYVDVVNTSRLKGQWNAKLIYGYAYVQGISTAMWNTQADYSNFSNGNAPVSYVGTTGQNRRLFRMKIQPDISLDPTTLPDLHYSLNQWSNGSDLGWTGPANWGQWTGDDGKATCNLKMWFGSNFPNFHVYYIAHNEGTGWSLGWQGDGYPAGRNSWRMEAFAFCIVQY